MKRFRSEPGKNNSKEFHLTMIEEWKENKEKYNYELENIKEDNDNDEIEKDIQNRLYKELGGIKEYETKSGKIDLLTNNELIEIKLHDNWKQGLGQLLVYNEYITNHNMRLHLFDGKKTDEIINICNKFNIIVTWEVL